VNNFRPAIHHSKITRFPTLGFGAPGRSSGVSEIFVATRATPFPSLVGPAYSAPDGVLILAQFDYFCSRKKAQKSQENIFLSLLYC
jgi:hypothetical protein